VRTTVEIVEAVQEQQAVIQEELKYALLCAWYWSVGAASTFKKMEQKQDQSLYIRTMIREGYESHFYGMRVPKVFAPAAIAHSRTWRAT
jgi:hypothetical protein